MDTKTVVSFGVCVICVLVIPSLCAPAAEGEIERERRSAPDIAKAAPKDMEVFKELVLVALQELAEEGAVNPEIILPESSGTAVEKRGRYIGWCARKSARKGVMYFPCYKN